MENLKNVDLLTLSFGESLDRHFGFPAQLLRMFVTSFPEKELAPPLLLLRFFSFWSKRYILKKRSSFGKLKETWLFSFFFPLKSDFLLSLWWKQRNCYTGRWWGGGSLNFNRRRLRGDATLGDDLTDLEKCPKGWCTKRAYIQLPQWSMSLMGHPTESVLTCHHDQPLFIYFFSSPKQKGRRTARSQVNSVQDGKQSKNL